VIYLYK